MRSGEDTIAAIATAQGEGGIAIVRVSGPGALKALEAVFERGSARRAGDNPEAFQGEARPAGGPWTPGRLYYGHVTEDGRLLDEAMAVYMASPRSYTREDVCELHVHGGRYAAEKALNLVLRQGARVAEPGEFTLRAFLNGRIDLSQAEAVMAMIRAGGEGAFRAAARQMNQSVRALVEGVSRDLTGLLAQIEALADFPEEVDEAEASDDLEGGIRKSIKTLEGALDERAARFLREGLAVAIAGAPNAGKSSLMNAMLGSDRAIVTDVPGTTRDVLAERLRYRGFEITLMDTAGLREAGDAIEREGVLRARRAMDSADVVLLVLDGSAPEGEAERELLREADGRYLVALNKCDLGILPGREGLPVSARTGEGVEALLSAVAARAGDEAAAEELLTQPRQIDCARRAVDALRRALGAIGGGMPPDVLSVDLMAALDILGEITGRSAPDEVIDAVFRNFCVGK